MPLFLFNLEARATGRGAYTFTRRIHAPTVLAAINRAVDSMTSPHWGDAEITSASLTVEQLIDEPKP